jgi:hypothetical protein
MAKAANILAAALLVSRPVQGDGVHASRDALQTVNKIAANSPLLPQSLGIKVEHETDASSTQIRLIAQDQEPADGTSDWHAGLRLPFADASTPLAGEHQVRTSHFFLHVPKTGGESFADFVMSSSAALGLPPPCYRPLHTLLCRKTHCNVTSRPEGSCMAASEATLPTVIMSSDVPLLTMVRKPEDHVVSMYAHCQQPGGLGYGTHQHVSIQAWAELAARTAYNKSEEARQEFFKYCMYDPRNFQVAVLGGRSTPDALRAVRTAMWVGVTEYYDASLCLLGSLFQKKAACDCETGLRVPVPRDKHGTHTDWLKSQVNMDEVRPLIDSFTEHDKSLHSLAIEKLRAGLERFGLGCLVEKEGANMIVDD